MTALAVAISKSRPATCLARSEADVQGFVRLLSCAESSTSLIRPFPTGMRAVLKIGVHFAGCRKQNGSVLPRHACVCEWNMSNIGASRQVMEISSQALDRRPAGAAMGRANMFTPAVPSIPETPRPPNFNVDGKIPKSCLRNIFRSDLLHACLMRVVRMATLNTGGKG